MNKQNIERATKLFVAEIANMPVKKKKEFANLMLGIANIFPFTSDIVKEGFDKPLGYDSKVASKPTKIVDVRRKPTGGVQARGCATCGKGKKQLNKPTEKPQATVASVDPQVPISEAKTVQDVVSYFDGDIPKMREYITALEGTYSPKSKAEGLGKKILSLLEAK